MVKPAPMKVEVDMSAIEAKIEELKAVQRSVNETLAEVKLILREVKQVRADVSAAYTDAADKMERIMEDAAKSEIAQLGVKTKEAMDKAVEKVGDEFTKLENILLGTGPERDGESIPELIDSLPTCRRCKRKETPGGHKCERVVPDAD